MTLRMRTRHVRSVFLVAMLGIASVLAPLSASADTDLTLGGTAVIAHANGDNVNIRTAPGASEPVVGEVAEGSSVYVIDGIHWAADGGAWYQVEANGVVGFVVADYLTNPGTGGVGASTGPAVALDDVNVRSGPSAADPILATLALGEWVTLYGDAQNGFVAIYSGDYVGWVHASFLSTDGSTAMDGSTAAPVTPAPEAPAAPVTESPVEWVDAGTRYTSDSVNLRAAASTDSSVLSVLPASVELWITGQIVNGFAEVSGDAGAGWISTQYLTSEAPAAPSVPDAPAAPAPSGGGLIAWPVSGGEWSILQGYNGSSHYDSGLWQYGDSLDLVRTDGSTAGQPIYSPVSGTVRWFDPSTGGISIDLGNGYAFAMFHAYYDGSIQEGDYISQGQYVGTIAPPYEAAAGSNAHLHIAVWATSDGGNWSRESVPFTGALAISGSEFYNSGVAFEHTGTVFYP
jgi:uncharacterized protein YgiM (DUF1202 family)